jgi:hypothetical protein
MNKVTLEMDVRTAAAVRQVLFQSQTGYTNNINTTPTRVFEIREVIADFDDAIGQIIK